MWSNHGTSELNYIFSVKPSLSHRHQYLQLITHRDLTIINSRRFNLNNEVIQPPLFDLRRRARTSWSSDCGLTKSKYNDSNLIIFTAEHLAAAYHHKRRSIKTNAFTESPRQETQSHNHSRCPNLPGSPKSPSSNELRPPRIP